MNQISVEFYRLPLWGQLMLIATVLFVANFWLKQVGQVGPLRLTATDVQNWRVLRFTLYASLVAYVAVNFCLGHDGRGVTPGWDIYARGAFVVLVMYLTPLLLTIFRK